ncbi:unnamed protein product [marine sediment metagenome]|uniref:Uncharacterized protein n=1 Tax=marine sediment metagenome TaxID=412755 RepID=X1FMA3_9ZZZZ
MKALTAIIGMLAICILALSALKQGYDGYILLTCIAAIAGLGGFITGRTSSFIQSKNRRKKKKRVR